MPPNIPSPLRIILLSTPNNPLPSPSPFQDTDTHEIRTPYYSASIPLWRDTLAPSLPAWSSEWSKPEAGEVIEAIGAWILCFRTPATKDELSDVKASLQAVRGVISHHTRSSYTAPEPLLIALAMPTSTTPALEITTEEWEDLGRECGGWEYIDGGIPLSSSIDQGGDKGRGKENEGQKNEYGERIGMDRLVEALEANEWESGAGGGPDEFDGDDGDEEKGMPGEEAGLEGELGLVEGDVQEGTELREGLLDGNHGGGNEADTGGDEEVIALESLMLKMQAVKEMGADMPEAERKRFAAKAVREVMKNI